VCPLRLVVLSYRISQRKEMGGSDVSSSTMLCDPYIYKDSIEIGQRFRVIYLQAAHASWAHRQTNKQDYNYDSVYAALA